LRKYKKKYKIQQQKNLYIMMCVWYYIIFLWNIILHTRIIAYNNNNSLRFRTRPLKNRIFFFQNKCHSDLTVSPSAQNDTKPPYYMINIISEEMKKKFRCSFRHHIRRVLLLWRSQRQTHTDAHRHRHRHTHARTRAR